MRLRGRSSVMLLPETPRLTGDILRAWSKRARPLSPLHGRTRTARTQEHGWVSIKGGGWTWGEVPVLVSRKDAQLVFGLYGAADADRETRVSGWLSDRGLHATRVLGWAPLTTLPGPTGTIDVSGVRYSDGTALQPVLLATQSRIPLRVADLGFLSAHARVLWRERTCRVMGWRTRTFTGEFAATLGESLALLHRLGGTNDTLTWDNITLAAEWTDFEWFYVPGHPLPDGTTDERLGERQWKSCVDAFEVVDRLAAIFAPRQRLPSIRSCLDAYEHAQGPADVRIDWCGRG